MSRRNGDASTLRSVAFEVLVDEVESMDMPRDPTVGEHTAKSALYLRPLGSERGKKTYANTTVRSRLIRIWPIESWIMITPIGGTERARQLWL